MRDENRSIGLDVVRCVALLCIIGVHVFYHNGFYSRPQKGLEMLAADIMRWFTFVCVPTFIMLTGYLKAQAKLSKKYYRGIVPILTAWILISLICIFFRQFWLGTQKSVLEWVSLFFEYKGADYAWYIEMYIGLFLLCPFINEMFGWDKSAKYHYVLAITFIFMVFLPSLLNDVVIDGIVINVIPNYFVSLWPIAYYYLGWVLRRYQFRLNGFACALGVIVLSIVKGLMSYISAGGGDFYDGIGGGYSDFFVGGITFFLFMLLYQVEIKTHVVRKIFIHVSKRALHIYLLSSIADSFANKVFMLHNAPVNYWWVFPARVTLVFVISLLLSEVVYPVTVNISGLLIKCFEKRNQGDEDKTVVL